MQKIITILVIIIIIITGLFYINKREPVAVVPTNNVDITTATSGAMMEDGTEPGVMEDKTQTVIGKSVEGRDIVAYHFGSGENEVLFVGGIHGGYSANTTDVAEELMTYLRSNPSAVPVGASVTVIPLLNPDGLAKVEGKTDTVPGRFNANNVDLNRNFDCDWKTEGVWQSKKVSGGVSTFSEPESQAIKAYVENSDPSAVVVWYSAAGGVYSSSCGGTVSAETKSLTDTFAKASGYKAYAEFSSYEVNGDMVNWLARNGIPGISVLLTNHTDTEWTKNKAGIDAVLKQYAQ